MACPIPHTKRDQCWLGIGLAAGLALGYYFKKTSQNDKTDVRHVVLFKLKDDAPKEAIEEFLKRAREMPNKISEIKTFEIGHDLSLGKSNQNHPIAISASFKSSEDYLTYATHPEHLKVVALVKPLLASEGGRSAAQISDF
mmetsp:Transcript_29157/g.34359  ORF Transcript_29157/g.34359 Transcript_29157/m.34359 type:complete len:141 (+) Transcript_29157:22-444(+)